MIKAHGIRGRRLAVTLIALGTLVTVPLMALTAVNAAAGDVTGNGDTVCTGNGAGAITCTGTFGGAGAYDPVAGAPAGTTPTVTVAQTQNLAYQSVRVSWTNFTPSSSGDYDVGIYECRGAVTAGKIVPTAAPQLSWEDESVGGPTSDDYQARGSCYAPDSDLNSWAGAANGRIFPTAADGTGQGDIPVETTFENNWLGCDQNHPCWLAIVPNWGGNSSAGDCTDHSFDTFLFNNAGDSNIAGLCSWPDRIMVPIGFAPSPQQCPSRADAFASEGSPVMERAMAQWQSGWCAGAGGLSFNYDGGIDEYQARQAFLHGTGALTSDLDVAMVTQPVAAADASTTRTFTYAPLANTSIAIAYYLDDPATQQPVTSLKLDARLVAKLLTQSYSLQYNQCGTSTTASLTCDPAVAGNPTSIFTDPEFVALNPQLAGEDFTSDSLVNEGGFLPTIVAGNSDLIYQLTRWIAADPDAAAFLAGQDDGHGMHVNAFYRGIQYPTSQIGALDPGFTDKANNWTMQSSWFPATGLDNVAHTLVQDRTSGVTWYPAAGANPTDPLQHISYGTQGIGSRALFAVVGGADAADFDFPTAQIENSAGQFVAPTTTSMATAIKDYQTNPDKITQQADLDSKDPAAYPLTMTSYAMVGTCGYSGAHAQAVARMLTDVAGSRQIYGTGPGELGPGYLALTAAQKAQTQTAAAQVSSASCTAPTPSTTAPRSTGSTTSPAVPPVNVGVIPPPAIVPPPATSLTPSAAAPSSSRPASAPAIRNADYGSAPAESSTWSRWVIPMAAALGGVLLLGGSGIYLWATGAGTAGSGRRSLWPFGRGE